ncbi:ureidoglycolate hydrolase [Chaetomidium leptoderma]|uniref:Ureidoglycolate hydrolase n=1 Tax=Chaetomidium leptoderma TaxID=669021 RepID=A0AAN6ZXV7_9PEZI|nr:ureidoglycolate hydrolase [Chaetomidium leptoderma]
MPPPNEKNPAVSGIVIEAVPLTREAFALFGDVVENPRPDLHPSSAGPSPRLPFDAITANQGSAIKYQHVSNQINLYDQSPSGCPASPVMSMFVCAARVRIPGSTGPPMPTPALTSARHPQPPPPSTFSVTVLERHPYTTQTFVPLTADPTAHYLVIVAPSLPGGPGGPGGPDGEAKTLLPVPSTLPLSANYPRALPGSGMPDLHRLRAFVANATQAVTYGAGTWHAPMVALGNQGAAVDFVVVQFANGVAAEDCQEVDVQRDLGQGAGNQGGIAVRLRPLPQENKGVGVNMSKL